MGAAARLKRLKKEIRFKASTRIPFSENSAFADSAKRADTSNEN
jgi:hypothetical protein